MSNSVSPQMLFTSTWEQRAEELRTFGLLYGSLEGVMMQLQDEELKGRIGRILQHVRESRPDVKF